MCHHTEERYNFPKECAKCNSKKLELKGTGTEQIEDKIKQFFPHSKILRFDADSTANRNTYKIILKHFS